ncbi:MAG TPA: DUF1905 domain-containing protein [Terrimesophilobacter sp.]|nr:DUF1905 domain-containing protein [Terrimesophilobacter sp.]
MPESTYTFTATLWQWSAKESTTWVFVTLPKGASDEIKDVPRPHKRGFGSVRVAAMIGHSRWSTSVFPDNESGCYVLPVKKAIRVAEGIDAGDDADITVTTMD